jgi:hypothetical protein
MSLTGGRERRAFESLVARREEVWPQQVSSVLGWNIGLGKGEVDSSILSSSTSFFRSTPKTILLNQIGRRA